MRHEREVTLTGEQFEFLMERVLRAAVDSLRRTGSALSPTLRDMVLEDARDDLLEICKLLDKAYAPLAGQSWKRATNVVVIGIYDDDAPECDQGADDDEEIPF